MTGVVLRGRHDPIASLAFPDAELVEDADGLLARLRGDPGRIPWVAIAPGVAARSDLAAEIQDADPTVSVVLLGPRAPSEAGLPQILPAPESETARARAALHREEAYVRSLLDTVEAVVLVLDADGTIREWNRRAESLYGVPRQEALGSTYFRFLPEAERSRVREDIHRLLDGGTPSRGFENTVRTPSGDRRLLWNATPVEDERGERAVLATGVDLTELLEAEGVHREMERRAREAEKLASITALTAGIAHEVATPMTAILGYAGLIAKSVGDEKNRKRATTIVEQVNRVSALIETLMSLSRTEDRPARPVELADVIDEALDFYREKMGRRGVEILRDYQPAPRVLGDPRRLHQVFLNLCLDAAEAMPDGGTLRVQVGETESSEALVRFHHSGRAGDPGRRARIFDREASDKPRAGGGGLVLLVAKTIVEEHGGTIGLTNEPGSGTGLRLVFPRLQADAP